MQQQNQQNMQKGQGGRKETFQQTFQYLHFTRFLVPFFPGSFWVSWSQGPNN